ncbi:GNAT family N-acetyltransferase [Tropicimonas sp. S265A]|uniref:GNAT family N-acetyltransferase n=1 Tax=Tropicimonas sp. S265A TaxID=3415134 RepID=UPI003C7A75FB
MTDIWAVIDATWTAPRTHRTGPFLIREGQGGGQRVSAATSLGDVSSADIEAAAQAMRDLEQTPLFMVRGAQAAFDAQLEALGYVVNDPVVVLQGPIEKPCAEPPPPVSAFPIWPPLHIMRELWETGGIGPERLAVMNASSDPKTAILGRAQDRAVGCAFVSIHDRTAMIHAVEVIAPYRRKGAARNMVRGAALWARDHGATRFATLTTRSNTASQALFASLGLNPVEHYHYRILREEAHV